MTDGGAAESRLSHLWRAVVYGVGFALALAGGLFATRQLDPDPFNTAMYGVLAWEFGLKTVFTSYAKHTIGAISPQFARGVGDD
ncbi:hypothetical protein [Halorubrum tropicale]|uniref:Uncharacterized protein n=1 Tax=Halorubrum tropicale TaxID=1765655 RepID=A0A0M9AN59_9EURY|nr:hypothetical protein [Halorubrum tropicale]KOX94235.1 hypothetical protein AMR74_16135 [Halorubrum tropicale]